MIKNKVKRGSSPISILTVYRCRHAYNLYSGTVFQQRHLTPAQAVLLLRGILKGEPSKVLAAELGLHYLTVLQLRHALQANAEAIQPNTPLPDLETESDEMFQNAGKKVLRTTIQSIRRAVAPINDADVAPLPMIVCLLWA